MGLGTISGGDLNKQIIQSTNKSSAGQNFKVGSSCVLKHRINAMERAFLTHVLDILGCFEGLTPPLALVSLQLRKTSLGFSLCFLSVSTSDSANTD